MTKSRFDSFSIGLNWSWSRDGQPSHATQPSPEQKKLLTELFLVSLLGEQEFIVATLSL